MERNGHNPAPSWRPNPEMAADFGCVLAAWAVAYLLRLGVTRLYVVTFVPEVMFIFGCAVATVAFLKFKGQYLSYRTRFHRGDARRILLAALGVGFGFSAVARFLDLEIISRTAILLAPPLSAVFMINWRLALDHFGPFSYRPDTPQMRAPPRRNTVVVINPSDLDISPIYSYFADPEVDFDLFVYGRSENSIGKPVLPASRVGRMHVSENIDSSYADVAGLPNAVIALPQYWLSAWKSDLRYQPLPGHRFVTIESLVARSLDIGSRSVLP